MNADQRRWKPIQVMDLRSSALLRGSSLFQTLGGMMRPHTTLTVAAVAILLLLAGGCANPWKEAFEPNRDLGSAQHPRTTLGEEAVREVEYERLQKFAESERQRRIASATAPADRSPDEKRAAKDRLLEALQLPWRGDEAIVLGSSQFVTAAALEPRTDKKLRDFARNIGADTVVVSSAYLGQAQRMETVPVTSYTRDTYIRHSFDRHGRRVPRTESVDSSSTTWIPMQVTEDRYAYHAFFVRRAQ